MPSSTRLLDYYLPPQDGFILVSLVATTYQVDFEFLEEELIPVALGVRTPLSRMKVFRSEVERRLQATNVTILYDLAGCERLARLSPRIDPIPIASRKLHAKITLQLWTRPEPDKSRTADRRLRLVVGSANLTRQGFRENYECVASLDYGGRETPPRGLLEAVLRMLREIAAETMSDQLDKQLTDFEKETQLLPEGTVPADGPVQFTRTEEVLPALQNVWKSISSSPPSKVVLVSPFWPEGTSASEALAELVRRLEPPGELELVCRGVPGTATTAWLPEFDAEMARRLREQLGIPVFLRAASPDYGTGENEHADTGDETEDAGLGAKLGNERPAIPEKQRFLHAKAIILTGAAGTALYVGSSNCTRRDLGLGGPSNWEAGFVYRLGSKDRKLVTALLAFAGPPIEVFLDSLPHTKSPDSNPLRPGPVFLSKVIANGTKVTIHFHEGQAIPEDLRILMEDLTTVIERRYWILYRRTSISPVSAEVTVDLEQCPQCDESEIEQARTATTQVVPHVEVEVRWNGAKAPFPVRFEDKTSLPLVLLGRKLKEGELIEYFLYGREPSDGWGGEGTDRPLRAVIDEPIETRGILAYFIRRFVQAIPGIEAELSRAAYSRPSLEAALRGPISPLVLAEHAAASLGRQPPQDEPRKTVTAVGFQLVEIIAALLRVRRTIQDQELASLFDPVVQRCRELLDALPDERKVLLRDKGFQHYRRLFVEGAL